MNSKEFNEINYGFFIVFFMSMIRRFIKLFIFLLCVGIVFGFDIPNYEGYVTDKVGIFSEKEKLDLVNKIEEIEKITSIEIAILIVPTVDDDINLTAVEVGNTRGVGKKGKNNGIIILIAIQDRKRSIQVGYGLEGILPDLVVKYMGDKHFSQNFREGKYYQGMRGLLDDMLGYIKQDPEILKKYSLIKVRNNFDEYIFFLVFILSLFFGRWITVPCVKGNGRKMRKYGRWMYAVGGLVVGLILTLIIANFVVSLFLSYTFLLFSIFLAKHSKMMGGNRGIWFGGAGSSWGGGSGFGGFGGGSFGGGGSSGSW